jgi:hypothetical protein
MTQPETHEMTANGNNRRRASERANAPDDLQGVSDTAGRLRAGASAAAQALPEAASRIRGTVDTVAERFPDAMESARTTAFETAESIRGLPEPTRRSLAALSIGLGIGLALAGAPRLLTMAALAPALVAAMVATVDEPLTPRAGTPRSTASA